MHRKITPLIAATCLACLAGCNLNRQIVELEDQIRQRDRRIAELDEQAEAQRRQSGQRQEQIERLQALGEKRLEKLFHTTGIQLGRYTAGYDSDSRPGDDGVRVYLQTLDAQGSVIKAAGDVTIQLFDLALPQESRQVAECRFSVDEISTRWASGFLTYHFVFDCPWPAGPPEHEEITVRVEFVDYLTGKQFTAQQVVKVRPPAKQ